MGGSAAAEGGAGAGGAFRGVSETSEISSSESWSGSLAEDSFFGGETSGNSLMKLSEPLPDLNS